MRPVALGVVFALAAALLAAAQSRAAVIDVIVVGGNAPQSLAVLRDWGNGSDPEITHYFSLTLNGSSFGFDGTTDVALVRDLALPTDWARNGSKHLAVIEYMPTGFDGTRFPRQFGWLDVNAALSNASCATKTTPVCTIDIEPIGSVAHYANWSSIAFDENGKLFGVGADHGDHFTTGNNFVQFADPYDASSAFTIFSDATPWLRHALCRQASLPGQFLHKTGAPSTVAGYGTNSRFTLLNTTSVVNLTKTVSTFDVELIGSCTMAGDANHFWSVARPVDLRTLVFQTSINSFDWSETTIVASPQPSFSLNFENLFSAISSTCVRCRNGGVCNHTTLECDCGAFAGFDCSEVTCTPECANGGVCVAVNTCDCNATNFTDALCGTPVCSNECANNGTCVAPDVCNCTDGWAGDLCDSFYCSLGLCQNSGVCSGPQTCNCTGGWSGPTCEMPTCSEQCQHGGTCGPSPNTCNCSGTGYLGSLCQDAICDPLCVNGRCIAPNNCSCPSNFTGPVCDIPVCTPSCKNGGSCQLIGDTIECLCATGWLPPDCGTPVCDTTPCRNGGQCIGPNVCDCTGTGFTGSGCEQPLTTTAGTTVLTGTTPPPLSGPCDVSDINAKPRCAGLFPLDKASFTSNNNYEAELVNAASETIVEWNAHFDLFLNNQTATTAATQQCLDAYSAYYCLYASGVRFVCQPSNNGHIDSPTCGMSLCIAAERACSTTNKCQQIAADSPGCYSGLYATPTGQNDDVVSGGFRSVAPISVATVSTLANLIFFILDRLC